MMSMIPSLFCFSGSLLHSLSQILALFKKKELCFLNVAAFHLKVIRAHRTFCLNKQHFQVHMVHQWTCDSHLIFFSFLCRRLQCDVETGPCKSADLVRGPFFLTSAQHLQPVLVLCGHSSCCTSCYLRSNGPIRLSHVAKWRVV